MSAGKEHTIVLSKEKADYASRNKEAKLYGEGGDQTMQAVTVKTEQPRTFTRRIGSTIYRVGVHYSRTSRETMDDKIYGLFEMKRRERWRGHETKKFMWGGDKPPHIWYN